MGGLTDIRISPNPKQELFFNSHARYTAYGGARGGGKSWAMRVKLVLLALRYDGIPDGSRHMDGDHFAISVTPAMQTYNLSDCGFKIYAIRLPRTRAN